ncbi:MAG: GspH/FimT family pseudopilin [Dechloromonas sp.]|nr:MAG: GspH/FimT family pseudopilin [Dechloromonas sp.]
MKQARGFTLIELLITFMIAAILAALAAPSFTSFIKNNRLTTTTNDLLADLALARSEAAKRGQQVTLCISTNGSSCTGEPTG